MSTFRFSMAVGSFLILLVGLAGEGFAQRGDRVVRVQGRQPTGNEQRVALVIGKSSSKKISRLQNPVSDAPLLESFVYWVFAKGSESYRLIPNFALYDRIEIERE